MRAAYEQSWNEQAYNEQYQIWLKNNKLTKKILNTIAEEIKKFRYKPKISIFMSIHKIDKKWLPLTIESVLTQIYPKWELYIISTLKKDIQTFLKQYLAKDGRIKFRYISKDTSSSWASNVALGMVKGEFITYLGSEDEITKDALFQIVKLLNKHPNLDIIYSDEDKKDGKGRRYNPFFKPDWSPDLLLSTNYIGNLVVIKKNLIEKIGGFRSVFENCKDYDLILRATELTDKIGHVPKPIYTQRCMDVKFAAKKLDRYARRSAKMGLQEALDRRGLKGEVLFAPGDSYRVKYAIQGKPLVSIIIPTKDRVDLLKSCIDSIEKKTSYDNYEIIIVDNDSKNPATLSYFGSLPYKVLKFGGPFNFSKINNYAAEYAKGEHLLFLNNDVEVINKNWLESMLEHSQRSEVGMVGALLLFPKQDTQDNEIIQHAGVIFGICGIAFPAFIYFRYDESNYYNFHRVIRNYSVVTAACAMMRRKLFKELNGFDGNLKVAFGDVDLCLRLREMGYSIIYTPYARLYHHERATRGRLDTFKDEMLIAKRWKKYLVKSDPHYNPNLNFVIMNYSIGLSRTGEKPLDVLLDTYHYLKRDLHQAFPEVCNGNYQRLLVWAATNGIEDKTSKVHLQPYSNYYRAHTTAEARSHALALVSIIVLNYNGLPFMIECIRSLQKLNYSSFEIIIVDNGSTDGSLEAIRKNFGNDERIRIVENNQNLGYGGGMNRGIKASVGNLILLMNNDTVVDPKMVSNLVEAANKFPDAGIFGGKIYYHGTNRLQHAGGLFDHMGNPIHRGLKDEDHGQYEKFAAVDWISGACMMLRKKVFDKIGLFDEEFFLYYEENDLCKRARKAGFKILFVPHAKIWHIDMATASRSNAVHYYFHRSRVRYALIHNSVVQILITVLYIGIEVSFSLWRAFLKDGKNRRTILFTEAFPKIKGLLSNFINLKKILTKRASIYG